MTFVPLNKNCLVRKKKIRKFICRRLGFSITSKDEQFFFFSRTGNFIAKAETQLKDYTDKSAGCNFVLKSWKFRILIIHIWYTQYKFILVDASPFTLTSFNTHYPLCLCIFILSFKWSWNRCAISYHRFSQIIMLMGLWNLYFFPFFFSLKKSQNKSMLLPLKETIWH